MPPSLRDLEAYDPALSASLRALQQDGAGGSSPERLLARAGLPLERADELQTEEGRKALTQEVLEHELVAKRRTSLDAIRRGFCAVDLSSYLSIFSSSRELAELLTTAPQQQAQHAVTVAPAVPK